MSVAIGQEAGFVTQGYGAVAVGYASGNYTQGQYATSIGWAAGYSNQGQYSVAVGYGAGYQNQAANSIAINATNGVLSPGASGFFVTPVRNVSGTNLMEYNPGSGEISYGSKTFVIDHPTKENHHLIHACLEGPEAGVYYRGETSLKFDRKSDKYVTEVSLPDYVMSLAKEFTVHVNPVVEFDNDNFEFTQVVASKVKDGKFKVYSNNNCKVHWLVFGKRFDIKVEVKKDEVQVKGQGPYKWI